MNFDLNENQALLRNLIERFAAERYDLARRRNYRATPVGYSPENWAMLAELGVLALPFAEADGGLDGGAVELITVMEAAGHALVAEPLLEELLLGGGLLAAAGTATQKSEWLPRIIAGEAHVALAHAEHRARFNLSHVETRAGPGRQLHGRKTFVLSGAADAFIVSAREAGAVDAPQGLAFFLVPADAPGVTRRPYRLTDGTLACELALHGATPTERLAGGFEALEAVVTRGRLAACAEMVGLMSALFDATLEYVRTRCQFGAPIGSFQAIQHRMAELYVQLELSRSQLYRAALSNHGSSGGDRLVTAAKSFISAAAMRLGEECIQLHGGIGTTDELAIGHSHKRILLLSTLFGDAEHDLLAYHRSAA